MRFFLLSLFIFTLSTTAEAAFAPPPAAVADSAQVVTLTAKDLSRKAVEAKLGRKLTFKERLGLSLARGQAKRAERKAKRAAAGGPVSGLALGSLGAGILATLMVIIGGGGAAALLWILLVPTALVLGIVALTQFRKKPERTGRGFAIAGIALGGAWLFIILLALLAVAAIN